MRILHPISQKPDYAGSGPEKDLCLELVVSHGARVTVHGVLSHEELGRLMRRCDIFALPSFFEGLPMVLLEAMACGCRVVSTDLPGAQRAFCAAPSEYGASGGTAASGNSGQALQER